MESMASQKGAVLPSLLRDSEGMVVCANRGHKPESLHRFGALRDQRHKTTKHGERSLVAMTVEADLTGKPRVFRNWCDGVYLVADRTKPPVEECGVVRFSVRVRI